MEFDEDQNEEGNEFYLQNPFYNGEDNDMPVRQSSNDVIQIIDGD